MTADIFQNKRYANLFDGIDANILERMRPFVEEQHNIFIETRPKLLKDKICELTELQEKRLNKIMKLLLNIQTTKRDIEYLNDELALFGKESE